MNLERLKEMVADDDDGILAVKGKPANSAVTGDERLVEAFQEVNTFIANHQRLPDSSVDNMQEWKLFSRL